MEILNSLNWKKYSALMDFLAFVGMYDDANRTKAFKELMVRYERDFRNATVVEAGAGFGILGEFALELGARKVYLIERNKYMFNVLREKFSRNDRIKLVYGDVSRFGKEVDILVHDLYGSLLYDESLYVLEKLAFRPKLILPNSGKLKYETVPKEELLDETVNLSVWKQFEGVLVSDIFAYESNFHGKDYLLWNVNEGLSFKEVLLDAKEYDVLVFYMEVWHDDTLVCRTGECTNWSFVFTPVVSRKFEMKFRWKGDYMHVLFRWKPI